jgi:hypothetical protein
MFVRARSLPRLVPGTQGPAPGRFSKTTLYLSGSVCVGSATFAPFVAPLRPPRSRPARPRWKIMTHMCRPLRPERATREAWDSHYGSTPQRQCSHAPKAVARAAEATLHPRLHLLGLGRDRITAAGFPSRASANACTNRGDVDDSGKRNHAPPTSTSASLSRSCRAQGEQLRWNAQPPARSRRCRASVRSRSAMTWS